MSTELRHSGAIRTLTPTGSRLRRFPQLAGAALLVAMGAGIPAAPGGTSTVAQIAWWAALVVGTLACCGIATWAEQRLYRGLVGVSGLKRLALTLFIPLVAATVVWPLLLMAGGIAMVFVDDGVLLASAFFGGAWFLSASVGTILIVVLDVLISAVIPDFRSRIQAAVLGLLLVSLGFTWTVSALGHRVAAAIREAAVNGNIPGDIKINITSDDTIQGQAALDLLSSPETESFIAVAIVFIAAVLGLPAILSACGKLADAVMERLNPLGEAMEKVAAGDLDVRVEVGGSRDLVQITEGFNTMATSLTTSLSELDVKNRELVETNEATSRFVPFQFLHLLDKETIVEIQRGDQAELDMSVMFCDIRGFTTMAERIGPQATFAFINRYLAHMEAEIHRENGFINDFMGDGIMALFHDGADSALRAALGMLDALERFNATLHDEGTEPIRIGIGLNSGTLMLGTIGGRDRLSCTVIGDPANMAARVEGMTKLYRASLLISEGTYRRLEDVSRYLIREVDRVQAQGKTEPAVIYEVLTAAHADKLVGREPFASGLLAYRRGDFEGALELFERCLAETPDDGSAALYVERCEHMIKRGPPTDWDGVTRLTSK